MYTVIRGRCTFAYERDQRLDLDRQEVDGIFPTFDYPKPGKDFLFLPLHFGERTVGYVVIRNAVYLMEKQYLFQIMNALTRSMENLHKKEMLAYMNKKLSSLYIMDTLTGMYNRIPTVGRESVPDLETEWSQTVDPVCRSGQAEIYQ